MVLIKIKKILEKIIPFIALAGVALLTMSMTVRFSGHKLTEALTNLFFYFTFESNIFVALLFFSKWISKKKDSVVTGAVTLYIVITGIIYAVLLSGYKYAFDIYFQIGNVTAHYIVPALCFIYWLIYSRENKVNYRAILYWLIYPLLYLVMTIVRGSLTDFYPYPFINVSRIGLTGAFINSFFIFVFTILLSGIIIFINNKIYKKR